jgi:hypothetical protein
MKLSIPLKDIMLTPGRRFDPSFSSECEVIERVRKIYGVIAKVMDVTVRDGTVEIATARSPWRTWRVTTPTTPGTSPRAAVPWARSRAIGDR